MGYNGLYGFLGFSWVNLSYLGLSSLLWVNFRSFSLSESFRLLRVVWVILGYFGLLWVMVGYNGLYGLSGLYWVILGYCGLS